MKDLRVEGGAVSTIQFSPEEFKSARKRFFNLFALSSSRIMSEGQEHLRTSRKIAFGMIIVLGIIGALLGYSIHGGNRTENEDALEFAFSQCDVHSHSPDYFRFKGCVIVKFHGSF